MMSEIICHECKRELDIKYSSSIAAVCEQCGTVNRKNPQPADYLIKFGIPEEDYSPIQVGTEGQYGGNKFEVTGRFRYDFKEAFRNQWSIAFSDGTRMWMLESYGYYAIVKNEDLKIPADKFKNVQPSNRFDFDNNEWTVETCYRNYGYKGEGELHEWIPTPVSHVQVETSSGDDEVIFTNILSSNTSFYYHGKYFEFDQLKFKNFRTGQSWN
jgi:hypothetical protein